MKKLLCIALFSMAIMANANNKKEVVMNNSNEIVTNATGKNAFSINSSMESENIDFVKETFEDDRGCGSQANFMYNEYRAAGMSHREARAERRSWVRNCRGYGSGGIWNL